MRAAVTPPPQVDVIATKAPSLVPCGVLRPASPSKKPTSRRAPVKCSFPLWGKAGMGVARRNAPPRAARRAPVWSAQGLAEPGLGKKPKTVLLQLGRAIVGKAR